MAPVTAVAGLVLAAPILLLGSRRRFAGELLASLEEDEVVHMHYEIDAALAALVAFSAVPNLLIDVDSEAVTAATDRTRTDQLIAALFKLEIATLGDLFKRDGAGTLDP